MQVAKTAPAGSVLLAMLPDTGERYLSTPLFEGIVEDMDADEVAIMKSTPNYQMP
jgi:cysteine synthase A